MVESLASRYVTPGTNAAWARISGKVVEVYKVAVSEDGEGYECNVKRADGTWSNRRFIHRHDIFATPEAAGASNEAIWDVGAGKVFISGNLSVHVVMGIEGDGPARNRYW